MLELNDIKKDYQVAGGAVHALRGVSIKFRRNEFVSILGASGCGKTTLLNIIGGLDKYTSGDLLIEGVSTKKFTDRDWDTYRNHSIGFIFQSYHLIPHQTILQNVELALTISGVSKEERRRRAIEALEKVGLSDKLHNRPNQLSGGQAQRVAIARALINDPEIVLADEPTGALDSKTSVQIMELLKEISRERLVIMVTHNPELAEQYSTRIIRLLDGVVTDDSMPYNGEDAAQSSKAQLNEPAERTNKGRKKRTSMSFAMAFVLSLKNLLSKIKRTAMVSVAGSIGIIGVSMVLAISAGVQAYIKSMENDLLSGYPLTVTETAIDFNSLMDFANSTSKDIKIDKLGDKVYVDSLLETLMGFSGAMTTNVITEEYRDYVAAMPKEYVNAVQYGYGFDMSNYIFTDFKVTNGEIDPEQDTSGNYSVTGIRALYTSILGDVEDYKDYAPMISTVTSLKELPNNYDYVLSQYDILATSNGRTGSLSESELKEIFENKDSLIMVIDDNAFSDLNFGQYGYLTEEEFLQFAFKAAEDPSYNESKIKDILENGKGFDYFVGDNAQKFTWYPSDTIYKELEFKFPYTDPATGKTTRFEFTYNENSSEFSGEGKIDMRVKAILQKKKGVSYGCLSAGMYYTEALTRHTIEDGLQSNVVKYLTDLDRDSLDVVTYNFDYTFLDDGNFQKRHGMYYLLNTGGSMMSFGFGGSSDSSSALEVNLNMLAGSELPTKFSIYPLNFDSKDLVTKYLDKWNDACKADGTGTFTYVNADGETITVENLGEADKITYTDTVGLIITMVNTMIEMITVALMAFTALSLVVSTVMVGIITYVSVVERIKEIGILRAVGARKKDIKRLFIAETFIIGLAAGVVGIAVTYILSLILNLLIGTLFGIYTIAALPIWQAAVMILISVGLTLVSGLIPASAAAKKDPVVALRTE